jgi:uncharacterized membrane-anchored protein
VEKYLEQNSKEMLNKVPAITLYFWIIKILCTTVGETGADFLNVKLGFGLTGTSAFMGGLLLAVLFAQVRMKQYIPWLYWLVVVLLSVVGTLITDNLTDNLGVSLYVSTAVFSVALALTFVAWYMSEHSLSVHTIVTRRRELFYWAAILFTFSLGTAAGDLIAEKLQLGYPLSLLLFAVMIAASYGSYKILGASSILTFWIAYILTRPLGASIGDLLSQPVANGGIGFGTFATSGLFLATIIGLVVFMMFRVKRQNAEAVL